jgi:hypothetical protein
MGQDKDQVYQPKAKKKKIPRRFRLRLKKKKDEKTLSNNGSNRHWFCRDGSRSSGRNLPDSL